MNWVEIGALVLSSVVEAARRAGEDVDIEEIAKRAKDYISDNQRSKEAAEKAEETVLAGG